MSFFTITLILFLIIDAIGCAPVFSQAVEGRTPGRQFAILGRELLFALALMFFFSLLGDTIFNYLGIDEPSLQIASGIILFLISLKILFPNLDIEFHRGVKEGEEPFLVPLAIPTIAGPAVLATVMVFAHFEPDVAKMSYAILLAWALSAVIILASPAVVKRVSGNLLTALEKLMGMVLILLAMQRLLEGVYSFLRAQHLL